MQCTLPSHSKILCEKTYRYVKSYDLSTESTNILGILELGSIFWMNLVNLEYLRPKWVGRSKNMNENGLLSEIFETRYFGTTRCRLPYDPKIHLKLGMPEYVRVFRIFPGYSGFWSDVKKRLVYGSKFGYSAPFQVTSIIMNWLMN